MSLSVRRAWIEIVLLSQAAEAVNVALREESVDRNVKYVGRRNPVGVALREESVDRNGKPADTDDLFEGRSP